MILKIFPSDTTSYDTVHGYLPDAISCKVSEERNGAFDLEMEYPLSGIRYDELAEGAIILSSHDDGKAEQPFRIYSIERNMKTAKVKARHAVQMVLQRMPVRPYPRNSQTVASVMTALNSMSSGWAAQYPSCAIQFSTDITASLTYPKALPGYVLPFIVGEEGSIVDKIKRGEVKYSANGITLMESRGDDTGITIEYGKNISEITGQTSTGECYTGAFLYHMVDNRIKHSKLYYYNIGSQAVMNDMPNIQEVDITSEFDTQPDTSAAFETVADAYAAKLEAKQPWANLYNNISVSWYELSKLPEYSYLPNRMIKLCDTVRVVYPAFGLNKTVKVVKTVWDPLAERYEKIELDSLKKPLHSTIRGIVSATVRRMF
jgi:phage minor structural protein